MRARALLLVLLLAQLADAATFSIAIPLLGIGVESNPLAALVYHWQGMAGVLAFKAVAIVVTLGLLVLAEPRSRKVFYAGGAAGTTVGVIGAVTNTWAVLLLS